MDPVAGAELGQDPADVGLDRGLGQHQTLILFNALRAKGVDATRYLLTGANHGDLTVPGMSASNALPWSTKQTMGYIVSFLNKELGS